MWLSAKMADDNNVKYQKKMSYGWQMVMAALNKQTKDGEKINSMSHTHSMTSNMPPDNMPLESMPPRSNMDSSLNSNSVRPASVPPRNNCGPLMPSLPDEPPEKRKKGGMMNQGGKMGTGEMMRPIMHMGLNSCNSGPTNKIMDFSASSSSVGPSPGPPMMTETSSRGAINSASSLVPLPTSSTPNLQPLIADSISVQDPFANEPSKAANPATRSPSPGICSSPEPSPTTSNMTGFGGQPYSARHPCVLSLPNGFSNKQDPNAFHRPAEGFQPSSSRSFPPGSSEIAQFPFRHERDNYDTDERDCFSGGAETFTSSGSEWNPNSDTDTDSESSVHGKQIVVPGTDESSMRENVSGTDESSIASVIFPLLNTSNSKGSSEEREGNERSETFSSEVGKGNGEENIQRSKGKHCSVRKFAQKSKKHCCKFCNKMNSKMSTHLMRCHKTEPEVAEILAMEKGSKKRREAFIKLQDRGDFEHNWRVIKDTKGDLIPKYRQTTGIKVACQYLACPHCKALYLKPLLSKHERRCRSKPDGKRFKKGQCALIGKMLLPLPSDISSSFFEKVISKLRDDEVTRVIKSDSLILRYGERLFTRRDIEEHSYGQINGRLRELGRLCQLLRKKSEMRVANVTAAINPANFDLLVATVKELGQFSQTTNMCGKGSLVLKLGYSLRKCSQILKAEAIKNNNNEKKDECERFESLYCGDWFDRVSACASQSVQRARMNQRKLLPSVADVERVTSLLKKDSQSESYPTLARATLAAVTIFNRKRGGEVQRMKISDFKKSSMSGASQPEEEVLASLTHTERKLVKTLHRVEIRGKFNRAVPILLTPNMVQSIEKLIALHTLLGLDSDYIFITPSGERPYRGPEILKQYAQAAKVTDPSLFTATQLRKQLATLGQAMEISELTQDQLASFLGHDIRIHRNIYRQTLDVVQKAKVASVLFKVNRGMQLTDISCDAAEDEDIETEEVEEEENTQETSDQEDGSCELEHEGIHDTEAASVSTHDMGPVEKNPLSQTTGNKYTPADTTDKPVRQVRKKKTWTKEEAAAVRKHLSKCLILNRVPQKHECERALALEPVLRQRMWKDVKFFIYNLLKKQR